MYGSCFWTTGVHIQPVSHRSVEEPTEKYTHIISFCKSRTHAPSKLPHKTPLTAVLCCAVLCYTTLHPLPQPPSNPARTHPHHHRIPAIPLPSPSIRAETNKPPLLDQTIQGVCIATHTLRAVVDKTAKKKRL